MGILHESLHVFLCTKVMGTEFLCHSQRSDKILVTMLELLYCVYISQRILLKFLLKCENLFSNYQVADKDILIGGLQRCILA